MLKSAIIFLAAFFLGIAFAVNAIALGSKKTESKKSPNEKISVSIPFKQIKAKSRESAWDAANLILEAYHANGNVLSIKEYNDIFGFPQENPLHCTCGWMSGENLKIQVIESEEGDGYVVTMPSLVPLR